jgi:hypothetical protein
MFRYVLIAVFCFGCGGSQMINIEQPSSSQTRPASQPIRTNNKEKKKQKEIKKTSPKYFESAFDGPVRYASRHPSLKIRKTIGIVLALSICFTLLYLDYEK